VKEDEKRLKTHKLKNSSVKNKYFKGQYLICCTNKLEVGNPKPTKAPSPNPFHVLYVPAAQVCDSNF
jgi:hypothetical protein